MYENIQKFFFFLKKLFKKKHHSKAHEPILTFSSDGVIYKILILKY